MNMAVEGSALKSSTRSVIANGSPIRISARWSRCQPDMRFSTNAITCSSSTCPAFQADSKTASHLPNHSPWESACSRNARSTTNEADAPASLPAANLATSSSIAGDGLSSPSASAWPTNIHVGVTVYQLNRVTRPHTHAPEIAAARISSTKPIESSTGRAACRPARMAPGRLRFEPHSGQIFESSGEPPRSYPQNRQRGRLSIGRPRQPNTNAAKPDRRTTLKIRTNTQQSLAAVVPCT